MNKYAAFEIDKYPISISRFNYPEIVQYGNVLTADFSMFKGFDIVMGGSPCTFWSCAKGKDREVDKNGIGWLMFSRFVDAVRTVRPKWFLYENVNSMPANIKAFITEELKVKPIMINSALVSAQQRKRLYWTNIPGIEQPGDKGILLKDIIQSSLPMSEKSYCFTASYGGAEIRNSLERKQRSMIFEPITLADKSQSIIVPLGAAMRTREDSAGRFKRLEVRSDGKSNALTTGSSNSLICTPVKLGEIGRGGQGYGVYSVHGKTICLSANGGGIGSRTGLYKIDLPDGDYIVRKLTPIEAERCQTISDGYTAVGIDTDGNPVKISNTQRYKSIGNGWTVDVIAHILSFIPA